MPSSSLAVALGTAVVFAAFICTSGIGSAMALSHNYAHPAVLDNDYQEYRLPSHYRSQLLQTSPRLQALLSKSSWLTPGEQPVQHREADRIHRSEIYKVMTHAGFLPRRFDEDVSNLYN